MLRLPESVRIFVASVPTDMRKQADGLSALVKGALGQEPRSGHLFVFFNRCRDMLRIGRWVKRVHCGIMGVAAQRAAAVAQKGLEAP